MSQQLLTVKKTSLTSGIDTTRILIVNPMPSKNDANGRVERRVCEYLSKNPSERAIDVDILRLDVDVPKVSDDEQPTASYNITDHAQHEKVMGLLRDGHYHGVHVLGAACDHVPFDHTSNRNLVTDIFDLSIENHAGLFTICNGSFEYLDYRHNIQKGINELPNSPTQGSVNPETLKIIGHFKNQVSDKISSDKTVEAFKAALRMAPVLPTGRVGYMQDFGMQRLAKNGVLEILSTSPDMDARSDAQISALYDFETKALCMAPHIEYGPNAIKSEAERDHKQAQGRTKTPALASIPNLYVETDENDKSPWYNAGVALYAAWVEAINPAQNSVANDLNEIEKEQSLPPKVAQQRVLTR